MTFGSSIRIPDIGPANFDQKLRRINGLFFSGIPAPRKSAVVWNQPGSDDVFIFGGETQYAISNDIWRFNMLDKSWTYLSGTLEPYTQRDIASSNPNPGSRSDACGWVDSNGKFVMFGGSINVQGSFGIYQYNDVWTFDPATAKWTYINIPGGDGVGSTGSYPANPSNPAPGNYYPGSRSVGAAWPAANGISYVFGGYGKGATASSISDTAYLNDLWKLDLDAKKWTFVSGATAVNDPGSYNANNAYPPSRMISPYWNDDDGNLWLYGGTTQYSLPLNSSFLSDTWRFNVAQQKWYFEGGSTVLGTRGNYSTPPYSFGMRPNSKVAFSGGTAWLYGGYSYYSIPPNPNFSQKAWK